jgi:hypothetical protein
MLLSFLILAWFYQWLDRCAELHRHLRHHPLPRAEKAIIMAAIGNLIGTILVGFLANYLSTGDVSQTIASIVDLSSFSLDHALIAISFGLLANILFSLAAPIMVSLRANRTPSLADSPVRPWPSRP